MKTTGYSRPLALCSVMRVTASADEVGTRRGLEQRQAVRAGDFGELLDGRVAESALGHADRPTHRLVVGRVGDELEIAHQVANLATIVEAHRADEPVRNRVA